MCAKKKEILIPVREKLVRKHKITFMLNDKEMDAIFFTYKDSSGKEQISSVYVDFWSESNNGDIFPHSTALTSNFGA